MLWIRTPATDRIRSRNCERATLCRSAASRLSQKERPIARCSPASIMKPSKPSASLSQRSSSSATIAAFSIGSPVVSAVVNVTYMVLLSAGGLGPQPLLAVAGRFAPRDRGVRHFRFRRLLLDPGAMPESHLVDRVPAPVRVVLVLARADRDHDARPEARADDRVLRPRRAVEEVPLPQRALLAFDDQERLAGDDQEVLLVELPVV